MLLFIPASYKNEAERDAPPWACRFARVTGGWIAFDSEAALQTWRQKVEGTDIAPTFRTVTLQNCAV
jgi:hypothetical protein